MRQIQELQKPWQDRGRFSGLRASLSLEQGGLVRNGGTGNSFPAPKTACACASTNCELSETFRRRVPASVSMFISDGRPAQ
jgi:hypothetical protein